MSIALRPVVSRGPFSHMDGRNMHVALPWQTYHLSFPLVHAVYIVEYKKTV